MFIVNFWFFIGTLYLIILTVQEFRGKLEGFGKRNFFMIGFTVAMISYFNIDWWFIFLIFGMSILVGALMSKAKIFLEATGFLWLYTGFAIIDLSLMVVFVCFTLAFLLIYAILNKFIKSERKVPFYLVFFCSFVAMGLLYGLY